MRWVLIGNSGSGKSTLAHRIGDTHDVPVLDLDTVYFEPEAAGTPRPLAEVMVDVRSFSDRALANGHEGWVTEGCYGDVAGELLDEAPHLVWLDLSVDECRTHCRERPYEPHKFDSPEAQASQLGFLLDWVGAYPEREGPLGRPWHEALFERYAGPRTRIVSSEEVARFVG